MVSKIPIVNVQGNQKNHLNSKKEVKFDKFRMELLIILGNQTKINWSNSVTFETQFYIIYTEVVSAETTL